MVEIIYNEANTNMMKAENLIRLPKNIRQIGAVDDKVKIYTEDYVKSYLSQNLERSRKTGFILFGKTLSARDRKYLFVDGAISVEMDSIFHKNIEVYAEAWEKLKVAAKEFFPDLEMVGWACEADIKSAEDIGRRFFQEGSKIFLRLNEPEMEYYITKSYGLQQLEGYYIYYARNEAMQTYMIEQQKESQMSEELTTEVCSEPAVEQFRQIMKERKEIVRHGRVMTVLSVASSFLALVVLAIGITMMNNYEKMQAMEVALTELSTNMQNTDEQIKEEPRIEETVADITDDTQDIYIEETHIPTQQAVKIQETVEQQPQAPEQNEIYIVKKGDTLANISMQFYQTKDMVDSICELNHIDNRDIILCGQKILLP